jgi:3-(3-hydroxy-phenyl)propionate hydroxylase
MLPQGWVRAADSSTPLLSDDALGMQWSLIGFGVDPARHLDAALIDRWEKLGGEIWQWCHRGQAQHLAPAGRRLEALDENVLPHVAPVGWVAIVRPDRIVMAEGPGTEVDALLRQAVHLLEPAKPRQEHAAPSRSPAMPRAA